MIFRHIELIPASERSFGKPAAVFKGDHKAVINDSLVAFVDARFRSLPSRESRGLAGQSMGGFGALSLAGRHDDYSDSGSRFSPKVSGKWQPLKRLTVRASYGEGFRAPTLDVLTQKPAFSAYSITDLRTCRSFGRTPAQCGDANNDGIVDSAQPQIQVDATVIANPGLLPETSKQFSLGLVFDATDWLSLKLDVYNIKIDGRITNMGSQTIINRTLNPALGPVPAAFSVTRDPATGAITNV